MTAEGPDTHAMSYPGDEAITSVNASDPGPATGHRDATASTRGRVVVLSGPSAVGKSTVVRCLRERIPDLYFSVSATTRAPRPGEVDGVDYRSSPPTSSSS